MEYELLNAISFVFVSCFFLLSIKKKAFKSAILISTFYPTIASASGQESFKTATTLTLLVISVVTWLVFGKTKKNYLSDKQIINSNIKYFFLLIILTVYILVMSLFSPSIGSDYLETKLLFFLLNITIPYILIILVPGTVNELRFFMYTIISTSIVLSIKMLYSLFDYGIFVYLSAPWLPRLTSGIANPIWLGRYLSIGAVLLIFKFFKEHKLFYLLFLGTTLFAIVLTGSKAGVLCSVIGIIVVLLRNFITLKETKKIDSLLLTLSILALIMYFVFSHMNPLAFQRRFSFQSGTVTDRMHRIMTVFEDWKYGEFPFFGKGFATVGKSLSGFYVRDYPHNITIELLYELGIVGLILYYLPFVFLLFSYKQFLNKEIFVYFILTFVFLLFAQTSGDLQANPVPFIFLALVVSSKMPENNYLEKKKGYIVNQIWRLKK